MLSAAVAATAAVGAVRAMQSIARLATIRGRAIEARGYPADGPPPVQSVALLYGKSRRQKPLAFRILQRQYALPLSNSMDASKSSYLDTFFLSSSTVFLEVT